jgi:hypothetical protein
VRSSRSIVQHVLQLKLRFYQWRTREEFVYHGPAAVRRAIEGNGLVVEDRIRIHTKRRGFDYFVYLCRKATTASR